MPSIIVEKGPERGQTVEIPNGARIVFGRDETCDFQTADKSCSRRHFGIAEMNGRCVVRDLNSKHGTRLNGIPVESSELKDGDTVTVGESAYVFVVDASARGGLGGKVIAGYQVMERIGRGGMGTVYRAKQIALDREVALKILSHRYSDDKTFINRFFKEAQAAARLNHPNVVQVYDVREEGGLYLISLEMMSGGTVQDLASREGQLPIARVLEIACDAAKGLVYAEKKGIVHGDIKPDNLMINPDGHIKISDLGLARDAGEMARGEEGIYGTPHFISPEQAQGRTVDSRSDIYSLGATLYRLIAGVTPFTGSTIVEIVGKQINEEPLDLRELRPDCPSDLADLVAVMMAKSPDDRFESAASMLEAVESLGTTGQLARSGSKGMRLVTVIGLVVAVAATSAFFIMRGDGGETTPPILPTPGLDGDQGNGSGTDRPDPKIEAEKRRLAAARALIEAQGAEVELKRADRYADVEQLESLRLLFLEAQAAGPDTEPGRTGLEEAKRVEALIAQIEADRAAAAAAAEAKREEADRVFAALTTATDAALGEDRFAIALARALAAIPELEGTHREGEARDLRSAIASRATERAATLNAEADARLEAADFDGARRALTPILENFAAEAGPGDEFSAIRDVVLAARNRLAEVDRRRAEKRKADLKLDGQITHETLQGFYRDLARGLDLERWKRQLGTTRQELKTEVHLPRYDRSLWSIDRLIALRQAFIEKMSSGAEPPTVPSGSTTLPAGRVAAADAAGVTIERRGKTETLPWSKIAFDDAYRYLFRRAFEDPSRLLDMAIGCLEAGLLDEAERTRRELEPAPPADRPDDWQRLGKELAREVDAATRFDRILALRNEAREKNAVPIWQSLVKEILAFERTARGTRAFLLHSDGSNPFADEN